MSIFSWLRPKPRVSIEQLSYDIAYQIFPHYAFQQLDALMDIVQSSPERADGLFYLLACKQRGLSPREAEAGAFKWHQGQLDDRHACLVLQYPQPKPIEGPITSFEQHAEAVRSGALVIAPYFSVAVREKGSGSIQYYVLGQTSSGGGSVLRQILCDEQNLNLGPGPEPKLNLFLAQVRHHASARS